MPRIPCAARTTINAALSPHQSLDAARPRSKNDTHASFVSSVPLFAALPEDQVEEIASALERTIFQEVRFCLCASIGAMSQRGKSTRPPRSRRAKSS